MPPDVSRLALLSGVTIAVNEVWAIRNGREPATPIVAGAIGFVVLSITGQLWRWDVVNAVAALFLASAIIRHGLPLGSDLIKLANVKPAAAAAKNSKGK